MSGLVKRISDMGRRQEMGRIRWGVKTERAMKAIETFRFTSANQVAIEQIAALYGGTPKPWRDVKANPQDQFEVITNASSIDVFLPPEGLSCWYEKWGGRGCERRCDGETVQLPSSRDDELYAEAPCVCDANGKMECRPYTRLAVILPEINFGGVWRAETKSWNAAEEMPAMEQMAQQLQMHGVIKAKLSLSKRSQEGGSKKYIVPRIEFASSAMELVAGASAVVAIGHVPMVGEIGPGLSSEEDFQVLIDEHKAALEAEQQAADGDEDIVDAEIVEVGEVTSSGEPNVPKLSNVTTPVPDVPVEAPRKPAERVRKATRPKVPDSPAKPSQEDASEKAHRLAERAEEMGKATKGLSPQQKKMHAMIGEICEKRGFDPDELRHRCVWTLTGTRTESSSDLSGEEFTLLLGTLKDVLDGVRDVTFLDEGGVQLRKLPQP